MSIFTNHSHRFWTSAWELGLETLSGGGGVGADLGEVMPGQGLVQNLLKDSYTKQQRLEN